MFNILAENLKQSLLTTSISRQLMDLRYYNGVLLSFIKEPERLGTMINDQMALDLVTKFCSSDKVFLDIGAHIGSVVSMVQAYNEQVAIIAIEAIPQKVSQLRSKFPTIRVHQCAAGDENCEVSFYIDTIQSGYSSLIKRSHQKSQNYEEIKVPMNRIDDIVDGDIGVIKIDVEGAEFKVLCGAKNLIAQNRPTIMFESAPVKGDPHHSDKEKIWSLFKDWQYLLFVPNRLAHDAPSLNLDGFIDSHYYPRRTTNYFAVPNEKRESIKSFTRQILSILPK